MKSANTDCNLTPAIPCWQWFCSELCPLEIGSLVWNRIYFGKVPLFGQYCLINDCVCVLLLFWYVHYIRLSINWMENLLHCSWEIFCNASSWSSINPSAHVYRASKVLHEWESMRRFYNFMMTQNMLRQLRQNFDMLFGEGAQTYWKNRSEAPPCYNVKKVFRSTSLVHLDEEMTR